MNDDTGRSNYTESLFGPAEQPQAAVPLPFGGTGECHERQAGNGRLGGVAIVGLAMTLGTAASEELEAAAQ